MPGREVVTHDALQPCPYLPGRVARLPMRLQREPLVGEALDAALAASDRRVGRLLYRPTCPDCRACEAIRIPVATFRPRRDQRRALARCAAVRVTLHPPTCTAEHLALFDRHRRLRGLVDADDLPSTPGAYARWLVHTCTDTVEMRYTLADRLVGVGIVDLGATSASSVYFYWEPTLARLGLGTASVLAELDLCRTTGRTHLYLGLHVAGCPAMAYKAAFHPHERLVDGAWTAFLARGG